MKTVYVVKSEGVQFFKSEEWKVSWDSHYYFFERGGEIGLEEKQFNILDVVEIKSDSDMSILQRDEFTEELYDIRIKVSALPESLRDLVPPFKE